MRRVQQGTAARLGEGSATAPRRAVSTVDLPPAAALRRRTPRLLTRVRGYRTRSITAPKWSVRRWAATITAAGAGVAILLTVALTTLGGPSSSRLSHRLTSNAALIDNRDNSVNMALGPAIAAISTELNVLAQAVPAARPTSHPPRRSLHSRVGHRGYGRAHGHAASVGKQGAGEESSSVVTSGAEPHSQSTPSVAPAQTYAPETAPAGNTNQGSARSQSPSTSRTQPAGPTSSGPLGGLGSCVSGCT